MAQRCPSPPMRTLISVGGQHQGDVTAPALFSVPAAVLPLCSSEALFEFLGFFSRLTTLLLTSEEARV